MFSNADIDERGEVSMAVLQYKDISDRLGRDKVTTKAPGGKERSEGEGGQKLSKVELAATIERERAAAVQETEQRLRKEFEEKIQTERDSVAGAIANFAEQRSEYFARVEAEVVQLALSIAAKILHRESQVDPLLVAALVRIAIERMREGSSVTVRVSSQRIESWRRYFAGIPNLEHLEVVEDAHLSDQDCILETELGTTNLGLDTQLKEVEQGFFDLLALRPTDR
jgi:flagellar assembly protein FliH